MKFLKTLLIGLALTLALVGRAQAFADIPQAYRDTAADVPVAPAVFYALALLESGQSARTSAYRPWPWTLTVNKKPYFFDSRLEAEIFLKQALETSPQQLGIGLFQIEHRFHKHRFSAVEQMLDPRQNARAAADILREALERENGDVWKAVGRFHSATPRYAHAYQGRFGIALLKLIGTS